MTGADGIHSHLLHDLQLAFHGASIESHTEWAQIRVQADSVQLNAASIQVESIVGSKGKRAYPKRRLGLIRHLVTQHDASNGAMELRCIDVPTFRFLQRQRHATRLLAVGRYRDFGLSLSDLLAGWVEQRDFQPRCDGSGGVVFECCFDLDRCHVSGDFGSCDEGAPLCHVHRLVHHELDLAVDSGAGIPTRCVRARVDMHGHNVGFAELDECARVHAKRHIAIIPAAGKLPVDVDAGHGHHTIKIQIHTLPLVGCRQREVLAIPAFSAPGEFSGVGIPLWLVRSVNGPVVRESHGLPGRIVKLERFRALLCAFRKSPLAIEGLNASRNRING